MICPFHQGPQPVWLLCVKDFLIVSWATFSLLTYVASGVFSLLWRVLTLFLSFSSRPGSGWPKPNAELHQEGSGKPAALCWEGASSPDVFGYKGDQGVSLAACLSEVPSPYHQGKYLIYMTSLVWRTQSVKTCLVNLLPSEVVVHAHTVLKWFFCWPYLPPHLV